MKAAKQFRVPTLLIVATVIALLLGAFVAWHRAMDKFLHGMLVGKTGPIHAREKWPEVLKKLADDEDVASSIGSIQVFCLCQGFDPEYVWRMDATPQQRDHLIEKWNLTEVLEAPLFRVFDGYSHNSGVETPAWWKPRSQKDIRYFMCPSTLAGAKSDRFQMAYSEATETLYMHYWFNF